MNFRVMKNIVILFAALLMVFASCQKADIHPNMEDRTCETCVDEFSKSTSAENGASVTDDSGADDNITDPNNDEDEDKKKKKK